MVHVNMSIADGMDEVTRLEITNLPYDDDTDISPSSMVMPILIIIIIIILIIILVAY